MARDVVIMESDKITAKVSVPLVEKSADQQDGHGEGQSEPESPVSER